MTIYRTKKSYKKWHPFFLFLTKKVFIKKTQFFQKNLEMHRNVNTNFYCACPEDAKILSRQNFINYSTRQFIEDHNLKWYSRLNGFASSIFVKRA